MPGELACPPSISGDNKGRSAKHFYATTGKWREHGRSANSHNDQICRLFQGAQILVTRLVEKFVDEDVTDWLTVRI
jgi:hypothetical protein